MNEISNKKNFKQQLMIDENVTCMYREYAKQFGHIVYLSPQNIRYEWEHVILKPIDVLKFIGEHPNAIIWSIKNSKTKDKFILSKLPKYRKTMYYSCCSNNMYNKCVNYSLVDTDERIKKNAKLWFKGKDHNFWKYDETIKKNYDYVLIGLRGDKNEIYFINNLTTKIKEKRNVLWIGGEKHKKKINKSHHNIKLMKRMGPNEIKDKIQLGKIGILFTELTVEGFPQSFLEMTMCGVPVIYNINAPRNEFYFKNNINCSFTNKKDLILNAEKLLNNYSEDIAQKCRDCAVENYSLNRSFEFMKELSSI